MRKGFTYEISGITLDMTDMMNIKKFYEIECTTDVIMDWYDKEYDEAHKLATRVRELMDKYEYTEDEAIQTVMAEYEE